jgi:hypothetical protein
MVHGVIDVARDVCMDRLWQVQPLFNAHGDAIGHGMASAYRSKFISLASPKKLPPLKRSAWNSNVRIVLVAVGDVSRALLQFTHTLEMLPSASLLASQRPSRLAIFRP